MAIDASGLRRRKGLGTPPTGGTPDMEAGAVAPAQAASVQPRAADLGDADPAHAETAATPSSRSDVGGEPARTPLEAPFGPVRERVPPREAEARVPFTTRVAVSTKERLENACYHLRRRHQDFINEAIAAHLDRHGF